jgi:hypothetical protein
LTGHSLCATKLHMEPTWAVENLQVIRTLMERSAIYRRALAPIMLLLGILGVAAAILGWLLRLDSALGFVLYWLGVGLLGAGGAFLLVRRQSLKEAEPFWSPPTRRVSQAIIPSLVVGAVIGLMTLLFEARLGPLLPALLPVFWMGLYGCAIHAAGFFMKRGFKLFGWIFAGSACALFIAVPGVEKLASPQARHALMGLFFGGLHLVYGVYLYFTEKNRNEA